MDLLKKLSDRFWEEAEKDFSTDLGEIALRYVPKLECQIEKLQQENKKYMDLIKLCLEEWKTVQRDYYYDYQAEKAKEIFNTLENCMVMYQTENL